MNIRNAKKLHNGDQVGFKGPLRGQIGTVITVYSHPSQEKTLFFDVLLSNGVYLQGLPHTTVT